MKEVKKSEKNPNSVESWLRSITGGIVLFVKDMILLIRYKINKKSLSKKQREHVKMIKRYKRAHSFNGFIWRYLSGLYFTECPA